MPESVGPSGGFLNKVALDGYYESGDARAAWGAIGLCVERGLEFPPWVLTYLGETSAQIEDHLVNRDDRHPQRLWQALGLDNLVRDPDAGYDRKRDPEEVFEEITTWLTIGECKTVAEGATRYWREVLDEVGSPETARELFYRGRRRLRPASSTAR